MATWDDGIERKLTIISRGGMTLVRISPMDDLLRESKEIHIPLETLKEMVNAQ